MNFKSSRILVFSLALLLTLSYYCEAFSKESDAVYKNVRMEYILNADGSTVFKYSHRLEYETYFAVNRAYGETFVFYNPKWQKLTVTKSATTMKDGSTVDSPPNAFNEVLPGCAGQDTELFHLREMVITHAGLERGAVVDLEYTIETKAGFLPGLCGLISIGGRSPIEKMEVVARIPASMNLSYNTDFKPSLTGSGKQKIYSWNIENIDLVPDEQNQPPLEEFLPFISFSTLQEGDSEKHIFSDENLFTLNDKAKKKIMEITEKIPGALEKAAALNDYIHNSFNLSHCELKYSGYKPSTADYTFKTASGTKLDRAVLLKALLEEAGIKCDIDLLADRSNNGFENMLCFHSPVVVFEYDGILYYLNPNEKQHTIFAGGLKDKSSLRNMFQKAGSAMPDKLFQSCIGEITDKNEIIASVFLKISGKYIPAFSSEEFENILIKNYQLYGYDSANVKKGYLQYGQNAIERNLDIKAGKTKAAGGYLHVVKLPYPPESLINSNLTLTQAERDTPLDLGRSINEEYIFEFNMPESMEFAQDKRSVEVVNNLGKTFNTIETGIGKVKIYRKIYIDKKSIQPEDYHYYRELMTAWLDKYFQTIILKEKK